MSILRRVHSHNFTIVGNACLCDESLSAEALGVICYLIGRPHDWVVQPGQLADRFKCGRDRIQRIVRELIEAGYIRRAQRRASDTGIYLGIEYVVLDTKSDTLPKGLVPDHPQPENPVADVGEQQNPEPENPAPGNGTLLRTEDTKTESNKPPRKARRGKPVEYTPDFLQSIWQPYPRKTNTSKINAFKKWLALSDADQAAVRASIPTFTLSKRGSEEQYIPHLEFFISRRIFETVALAPSAADARVPTAVDRQTWENMARLYANNSNWPRDLGPEPGRPGCRMPPDLLQKFVNSGLTTH